MAEGGWEGSFRMARMSPKLVDYGCLLQGESSSESGEPRFGGRTARSCRVTYSSETPRHRTGGQGCFQGSKTSSLKCGALCGRVGTGGPWPDSNIWNIQLPRAHFTSNKPLLFYASRRQLYLLTSLKFGFRSGKWSLNNILKHMYKQTRATQIQLL